MKDASYELDLILYADNFLLVGREGMLLVREDCDQKGVLGVGQWVTSLMCYKKVTVQHVSAHFEMPTLAFLGCLLKMQGRTYIVISRFDPQYCPTHSMEGLGLVMDWNWIMTFSVSRFHTFVSPSKLPVAR